MYSLKYVCYHSYTEPSQRIVCIQPLYAPVQFPLQINLTIILREKISNSGNNQGVKRRYDWPSSTFLPVDHFRKHGTLPSARRSQ